MVGGGSRGGTIALLMGVRDSRVNTSSAGAAPVDFYREDLRIEYDDQYICWFLNGKSETESRQRMLASSPLYFAPNENLQNVFLYHGEQDEIVPSWNPVEMTSHLEEHEVDVSTYIYPGVDHSNWWTTPSGQADNEAGTTKFLNNIE